MTRPTYESPNALINASPREPFLCNRAAIAGDMRAELVGGVGWGQAVRGNLWFGVGVWGCGVHGLGFGAWGLGSLRFVVQDF